MTGEYSVTGAFVTIDQTLPCDPSVTDVTASGRERGMTVVSAMLGDGEIFLAADSAVGGLPVKGLGEKIEWADTHPLAWAAAGDEAIGDEFGNWLRGTLAGVPAAQQLTWADVAHASVEALAQRNGVRTRASQANRLPWNAKDALCQIMLVGFLEGRPEMLHLEVSGDWTAHVSSGRRFAAMGGGAVHAQMAYEVLLEKGALPAGLETQIREVMDIAVRHAPHCAPPIRIVRVTPQGVELLDEVQS